MDAGTSLNKATEVMQARTYTHYHVGGSSTEMPDTFHEEWVAVDSGWNPDSPSGWIAYIRREHNSAFVNEVDRRCGDRIDQAGEWDLQARWVFQEWEKEDEAPVVASATSEVSTLSTNPADWWSAEAVDRWLGQKIIPA